MMPLLWILGTIYSLLLAGWGKLISKVVKKGGNNRELIKGAFIVILLGGGLVVLMAMVMGRSPIGDRAERKVYKTVDGKELALWIYKPENWRATDQRACIIWFFGGAWKVGTPEQFAPQSKYLAKRGMVGITAEYRIKSQHHSTPVESTMDARSAMRWLKIHSDELGIDPERIVAGGGSSGGQLALACELMEDVNEEMDNISVSPNPAALILFNPVVNLDIPEITNQITDDELKRLLVVSPQQRLTSAMPPTIIFHGTADSIIPVESVTAFVEKAKTTGTKNITYYRYTGRGHEFYFGPGSRKDYKDTLEKTVSFLGSLGWPPE